MQPVRRCGSAAVAEDADFPGHAVRRDQGAGRAGFVAAGRRHLQPHLPAQRDRLRRIAAASAGHRGEQPHRLRDDDRAGPAGERRVAVAAAGPHRGHQPGVPGRARCARAISSTTRPSTSAARRTTFSPRHRGTRPRGVPGSGVRSPKAPGPTCGITVSTSPSSTDVPRAAAALGVARGCGAVRPTPPRPDVRRFHLIAVRAAAADQ